MRIIFKWWNFKCTLQKFRKTIHLRLDSLEKKKKKIRLFHSTTRFLYQHLIIVPLQCIAIPGLGFRRGSYRCICKRGFYYPDIKSTSRYYNGTVIEEEFEKLMMVSFLLFFFSLKHFRKNSIRVFFISQITTVENFICKKKSVLMMIYLPFWIFEIQSNVFRRRNFIWKSVMKKKRKKMYKASFVRVKFYSEKVLFFENLYKLFKK